MKLTLPRSISFLLIASLAALCGCASIVDGGRTKAVNISSVPLGAQIVITNDRTGVGIFKGTTPATVMLGRSDGFFKGASYTVSVSMGGYATTSVHIQTKIDGWYFGNIVFGGLIGMVIVDPATGAMYTLPKEQVVTLAKQSASAGVGSDANDGALVVMDVSKVPESMRSLLVAIQ
jgi:hypothetical protein